MSKQDVTQLQRALNEFTRRYLSDIAPLAVDGEKGPKTKRRIRVCKWYLGYLKKYRTEKDDQELRLRLAHPKSAKYATKAAVKRGKKRRAVQRKRAARRPVRLRAFRVMEGLAGVTEQGGNNSGTWVLRIIRTAGGSGPEPWCGDTVFYCYFTAGSKAFTKAVGRLAAYVPWLTRIVGVKRVKDPLRGDIVRYDWNRDGVGDHTGLFDRWVVRGHSFMAREGNTGKDPNVSDSSAGGDGVHPRLRTVDETLDFLRVTR